MKRRIVMAVALIVGVFAVENVADILVTRYAEFTTEVVLWTVIAVVCALIIYEVGEERGDW